MELLDRYLHAVKSWLPKAQQDDIIKELSDDILSEVEDKESELGRPLNEAEQAAILKHYGHPTLAATRYWPRQHLIGPAVFPIYWFVLKISVALSAVIAFITGLTVLTNGSSSHEIVDAMLRLPSVAITTFAWVTLVFAALEYGHTKFNRMEKWDPTTLPKVDKGKSSTPARDKTHSHPLADLIASAVFALWWLAVPRFPFLVFGPAASFLRLSPAVQAAHTTILLLLLLPVLLNLVIVLRPGPAWLRPLMSVISRIVALVMISVLVKTGSVVDVAADAPNHLAQIATVVNFNFSLVLSIASVVLVLKILMSVIRMIRGENRLSTMFS